MEIFIMKNEPTNEKNVPRLSLSLTLMDHERENVKREELFFFFFFSSSLSFSFLQNFLIQFFSLPN